MPWLRALQRRDATYVRQKPPLAELAASSLLMGGLLARFLSARALEHLAFVLTSRGRTASKKP